MAAFNGSSTQSIIAPKAFITADSGARESFASGMVRDSREGKGRFDLIAPAALRRLAQVYERGAQKYEERNWEQGAIFSRFVDSAARHLNDYLIIALYDRQDISLDNLPSDVNPAEDHLAQAAWNIFAIMQLEETRPEYDDLTAPPLKEDEPAADAAAVTPEEPAPALRHGLAGWYDRWLQNHT